MAPKSIQREFLLRPLSSLIFSYEHTNSIFHSASHPSLVTYVYLHSIICDTFNFLQFFKAFPTKKGNILNHPAKCARKMIQVNVHIKQKRPCWEFYRNEAVLPA